MWCLHSPTNSKLGGSRKAYKSIIFSDSFISTGPPPTLPIYLFNITISTPAITRLESLSVSMLLSFINYLSTVTLKTHFSRHVERPLGMWLQGQMLPMQIVGWKRLDIWSSFDYCKNLGDSIKGSKRSPGKQYGSCTLYLSGKVPFTEEGSKSTCSTNK